MTTPKAATMGVGRFVLLAPNAVKYLLTLEAPTIEDPRSRLRRVPDALVGRGVGDRTEQRERALFAVDGVLTGGERHVASGSASAVPDPESNELETLERSAGEVQLGVGEFSNRAPCVVRVDLHGHAVCPHASHPRVTGPLRHKRSPYRA